jgi:hypothetical protein
MQSYQARKELTMFTFTFWIGLPWLIIVAAFLIGIIVNLINHDHVFKHTERRGKHEESN